MLTKVLGEKCHNYPILQISKLRHKSKQFVQGHSLSKQWLQNLNPGSLPQHPALLMKCCVDQFLALVFSKRFSVTSVAVFIQSWILMLQ